MTPSVGSEIRRHERGGVDYHALRISRSERLVLVICLLLLSRTRTTRVGEFEILTEIIEFFFFFSLPYRWHTLCWIMNNNRRFKHKLPVYCKSKHI